MRDIHSSVSSLFLLYVSVMLVITFLQQEFVLIPELQNLDIVGEEAKAQMLEKWQKWRWLSFLIVPFLVALRISLVSLCFFVGSFFFTDMSGRRFKDWWGVAMKAQVVILAYNVVVCFVNIVFGSNKALEVTTYSSLLFLGGEDMEAWIKLPLSAINAFEIVYWLVLSFLVGRLCRSRFGKSFRFVMSSYGVGYLFYIVLLMFLLLYLS